MELLGRHALERFAAVEVFTEVGLDRRGAHLKQTPDLLLVPGHSLGIGEVDRCKNVLTRKVRGAGRALRHGDIALGKGVFEERALLALVGRLPQRDAKTVLAHVAHVPLRIRKTVAIEGPVADPVLVKPARVQVDHVAGESPVT